jgi:photosystem II stability/assembly factor-like uncharacterized protein
MKNKILALFLCMLLIFTFSVAGINTQQQRIHDDNMQSAVNLGQLNQPMDNIDISITPYKPPIIIPASGGSFQYSMMVTNNEVSSRIFDVWTLFLFPNGTSSGPVYGPVEFELPAGWSAVRENLSAVLTNQMPAGTYSFIAYTGLYPDEIWSSDSFTFEKLSETSGWYQQTPGLDEILNAVSFPDSEHGWAVSSRSDDILYTSNGGDTWYQTDDGLYYNEIYNAVYFVNDQTGWIGGSKLLKTTDGGMNWTEQYDPSHSIYGLYALDANTAWAVGGVFDSYNEVFVRYIIHTQNGGDTWTTQYYESGYYYDPVGPLNDIYFTDNTHGWAVGYDGAIIATTDGGANWIEQDSGLTGYYNELFGVAFTDSNNGWAVGEDGNVVTTMNGGSTWTQVDIGTTDYLNSVCFTDANNGWIAGGDYYPIHGTIFHTNDGGATWSLQDPGTGEYEYILYDISFVNNSQGWAAGGTFYPWESVMLHTETGGGDSVYPVLIYTPTALDYGEMYNSQEQNITMEIWNNGTGTLWYYFYVDAYGAQYLSFTPDEGFSAGEHDTITATLFTGGLQPGVYHWNVTLYSNDGILIIPVDVTIIESDQVLAYEPQEYDFGDVPQYSLVTTNLSIWNAGTGTMYYWIDDSGTFCVVEPWSGSSQGEVNIHTIMCFTSPLELGPHQCNLTIYGPIGDPPGIVTIYVNVIPWGANAAPLISNENPENASNGVPITTESISVDITDTEGDAFFWSIETQPDIGSNSGTGANNGTKSCDIIGLEYNTTYTWFVNATDTGSGNTTHRIYTFTTTTPKNTPPEIPIISGPQEGKTGSPNTYNFMSTDINNNDVCYYVDWGDGSITDWTAYQTEGQPGYNENHTWSKRGSYTIKAKAKDAAGNESEWATLTVTMPFSYNMPFIHFLPVIQFLERLFERFPNAFPILRQLMGF